MAQYLPPRPEGEYGELAPRVVEYLTNLLERGDAKGLGLRNSRELRTLAQALDALLAGNTALAADTLMQRFRAVEMAAQETAWAVAQHMELIPLATVSSVSDADQNAAAKAELKEAKLRQHLHGGKGRSADTERGKKGSKGRKGDRRPGDAGGPSE